MTATWTDSPPTATELTVAVVLVIITSITVGFVLAIALIAGDHNRCERLRDLGQQQRAEQIGCGR